MWSRGWSGDGLLPPSLHRALLLQTGPSRLRLLRQRLHSAARRPHHEDSVHPQGAQVHRTATEESRRGGQTPHTGEWPPHGDGDGSRNEGRLTPDSGLMSQSRHG